MKYDWRLIVKLKSRDALRQYAEFRKLSGREIAKQTGLSQAIVNHLLGGRRTTCNVATASKIEAALGCPPGFLFEPAMSRVADTARRRPATV